MQIIWKFFFETNPSDSTFLYLLWLVIFVISTLAVISLIVLMLISDYAWRKKCRDKMTLEKDYVQPKSKIVQLFFHSGRAYVENEGLTTTYFAGSIVSLLLSMFFVLAMKDSPWPFYFSLFIAFLNIMLYQFVEYDMNRFEEKCNNNNKEQILEWDGRI
ncbi:MAG: hypothetical protein NT161_00870 [Candidatus Nomurabacteria bacterium]|nr:hypothetical protein [Candidatus Nomurabacteria bacterium]